MTRTLLIAAALSIAGIAAHAESPDPSGQFAHAVTASKTRAQVIAELKEAQRTGDILAPGDEGLTEYQLNPRAFPPREAVAGKTREEVQAETKQAIHDGDIIQGESGLTERETFPQAYAYRNATDNGVRTARLHLFRRNTVQ
jgi:predicted RNase H-like HicB family nuclease